MSKKNIFFSKLRLKYIVLALVLATMVSCIAVSGVFAVYVTSTKGTGSATLAKWGFLANINGVSCLDDDWGAKEIDGGYYIDDLSLTDVNYSSVKYDIDNKKERIINATTGRSVYEYDLVPGASGLLSIEVLPQDSTVALLNTITIKFVDIPSEMEFTSVYGYALTPVASSETIAGEEKTVYTITYDNYYSAEELQTLRAWNERTGTDNAIESGIRWSYPSDSEYTETSAQKATFSVEVTGKQVVSNSQVAASRHVHFTNGVDSDFKAGYINVLTDNLSGGINMYNVPVDTMIDLHGYTVSGASTITSSDEVVICIGTHVYTQNASNAERQLATPGVFAAEPTALTVTAPKGSVYVNANAVGKVSVSSGSSSFRFMGKFVMSEAEATAAKATDASAQKFVTEKQGAIVIRGGRCVVDDFSGRNNPIDIKVAQDSSASTVAVVISVEDEAEVGTLDASEITKAIKVQNAGIINNLLTSSTIDVNHVVDYCDEGGAIDVDISLLNNVTKKKVAILDSEKVLIDFYDDLESAIADVQNGNTIRVYDDLILSNPIEIKEHTFTIDLNNHNLQSDATIQTPLFYVNYGSSSTDTINVTLDNGIIRAECVALELCADKSGATVTDLVVNLGENLSIKSKSDSCVVVSKLATLNSSARLQTESTYVTSFAITTSGADVGCQSIINLNGGSVTGANIAARFASSNIVTIFAGVEILGTNTAILLEGGDLAISGGIIRSLSNEPTILVSQGVANPHVSLTISGGTFTGNLTIKEEDINDDLVDGISMSITGGTFNCTHSDEEDAVNVASENCVDFIRGGTFTNAIAEELLDDNCVSKLIGGVYKVSAQID